MKDRNGNVIAKRDQVQFSLDGKTVFGTIKDMLIKTIAVAVDRDLVYLSPSRVSLIFEV